MSHEMDFFDWPQLDEYYTGNDISANPENFPFPESNDNASLAWTDYFPPPNVSKLEDLYQGKAKLKVSDSNHSIKLQHSPKGPVRLSAVLRTHVLVKTEEPALRMMWPRKTRR